MILMIIFTFTIYQDENTKQGILLTKLVEYVKDIQVDLYLQILPVK